MTTDDTTDTDDTRPPERRMVPAGALVVAIMVAAALGILAVVALTVGGGGGGDDDVDAARLAAGRFAERFLSFEHDALEEWKSGVLSLSTGGFSEEVDDVEDGLERLIGEAQLDASAQVTDIFMGEIDKGSVSAVLVYDRDVRGASGARSENDRYVQLSLLLVDGEWLVDNVIDIATAQPVGAAAPPSGTPAPTTSEPAG